MKRLSTVLYLTLGFAFFEFLGAYFSNSFSLASDGVHMLLDVGGVGLAWIIGLRMQKESRFRSERLGAKGAYASGFLLILVSMGLAVGAIWRILHPSEIQSGIMLGVAVAGLIANLASLFLLRDPQGRSLNIRGAYRHVQGDALTSIGVIVGALLIQQTGQTLIDPLIGIAVACFVIWRAWGLIGDARQTLTASRAKEAQEARLIEIQDLVEHLAAYNGVHDLRLIGHANGTTQVAFHLVVKGKHPEKVAARVWQGLTSRGVLPTIEVCRKGHCRS